MRRVLVVAASVLALLAGLASPAPAQEAAPVAPTLTATPATDLVDGQTVALTGEGWWPGSHPRVEQCEVGTGQCSFRDVRGATDVGGHLEVEVVVRATFLTWLGEHTDCRSVACELRINRDDGDVGAPLAFDQSAPLLPAPSITVTPSEGLVDDEAVVVRGRNFEPGDVVHFEECEAGATSTFERCYSYGAGPSLTGSSDGWPGPQPEYAGQRRIGPTGAFTERLRVYADAYAYEERIDCRVEACDLVVARSSAILARAPLAFDPDAPLKGPARVTATSPSTELVAGDAVQLRGSGFYVREPVIIEQCVVSRRICGPGHARHALAGADGTFRRAFTVRNHARANYRPTDCRVVRCVLRISRYGFAPSPRHIDVPIELAP